MHRIYERTSMPEPPQVGAIATRSKLLFFGPPLVQYALHSELDQPMVLNSSFPVIDSLSISHDERTIAYSTSGAIRFIDLTSGREQRTLVGLSGHVCDVSQSHRSIYVWGSASSDCSFTLWDVRQHPANVQTRRFNHSANCLEFSPDDMFVAVGSEHLYLVDPRVRNMTTLFSLSQITNVCFHPSEYLLATGSEDKLVKFWDVDTRECVSQSEPVDGSIRDMMFDLAGTALITLTDSRCRAVSWEPFDLVGQIALPSISSSLCLGVDESGVYVLGHSGCSESVSVYSMGVKELVNHVSSSVELYSELLSEPNIPLPCEATKEGDEGDELLNLEMPVTDVFMSGGTLRHTSSSQSFSLSPGDKDLLKSNVDPKVVGQAKVNRRAIHATDPRMKVPDIRKTCRTTQQKPNLKESDRGTRTTVQNHSGLNSHGISKSSPSLRSHEAEQVLDKEEDSAPNEIRGNEQITEICLIDDLSKEHPGLIASLSRRKVSIDSLRQCWRSQGVDAAINDASRYNDISLLAELLAVLNQSPSAWSLSLCSAVLPHLATLMTSGRRSCVQVALASLRIVITGFGQQLRICAQSVPTIGVDVAAEERQLRCSKCVHLLTEMRVKTSLLSDKMKLEDSRELNVLMQLFDEVVSPV